MHATALNKARLDRLTAFAAGQAGTTLGADVAELLSALAAEAAPIKRWAHVPLDAADKPLLRQMTISNDEAELSEWAAIVGGLVVPCVDRDSLHLRGAAYRADEVTAEFRARLIQKTA